MNTSISSKITSDTNVTNRKRAKKMWDVKTNLETVDEIKEKLKRQHNPDQDKAKRSKSLNTTKAKKMNNTKETKKDNVGDINELHSIYNQIKEKNPKHIEQIQAQIINDIENEVETDHKMYNNPASYFNNASQFNTVQANSLNNNLNANIHLQTNQI